MVEVVGRRPGFLLVPSPPSFPEHFCELVGFEARHLLQRNESSGWHNAEVIILGRSFALSPTVSRQPLASQSGLLPQAHEGAFCKALTGWRVELH